jgi:Bacterial regulatory helix-turn-helix protein, lysR family
MLDLELLRAFVAVADRGGFHRAAERLNLTQSTVSQQIKRLELETERPLFRRTTRSGALTDDGEMLLGDARRLLQLEEAARQRLAAPRLSGTVRLGVVEEVAGTASARSRRRRRDASVPYQPRLRFAPDSPVEGDRFELPVPREKASFASVRGCPSVIEKGSSSPGPATGLVYFSRGGARRRPHRLDRCDNSVCGHDRICKQPGSASPG